MQTQTHQGVCIICIYLHVYTGHYVTHLLFIDYRSYMHTNTVIHIDYIMNLLKVSYKL